MKILLADDDAFYRSFLARLLALEFEVVSACDGEQAWRILQAPDPPRLAVLDWLMPGLDGLELCRRVRQAPPLVSTYLIIVTTRHNKQDILAGFAAGADDYVAKPFHAEELRARLRAGRRILELQADLGRRVEELQAALGRVRQLQRLLPICSYCKRIRDDRNYWQQLEAYFAEHSDTIFSHGVCPNCYEKYLRPELAAPEDRGMYAYILAKLYARDGERERALAQLRQALELHYARAAEAYQDEEFATLRTDPAFLELMGRLRPAISAEARAQSSAAGS